MTSTKRRGLQAGVVTLWLAMLGGYVVYSQRSQSPQQLSPGSKGGRVHIGGTNQAPSQFDPPLLQGALGHGAPSNGTLSISTGTNTHPLMMTGSKSAAVIRPDSPAPLTLRPVSNSTMIMPSSKSLVIRLPDGSATNAVLRTNVPPQP